VRENRKALDLTLEQADFEALDQAFKPPRGKRGLEML
jgi:hypothetical protein